MDCCWNEVSRSPGFHLVPSPGVVEIGEVGNLKIAFAMLIKSEVSREWLCEYSVL